MAESDCNLAIALDSNYFKAFARRGAARVALEKYNLALEGETVLLKRKIYLFKYDVAKLPNLSPIILLLLLLSSIDYETVLKLDPGNVDAETEVKKIKEVTLHLGYVTPVITFNNSSFNASDNH